jgi:AraC-like DNA-binding protein
MLARFVDRLWYVSDPDSRGWELKLPTTTAQVIINLDADRLSTRSVRAGADPLACGGVGLTAICGSAEVLDRAEQRRTAGIVIRPEAVGAFTGGSAEGLDRLVDLDSLITYGSERLATAAAAGRSGAEVLDLLEHELVRSLTDRPEPDAGCRAAITQLRSGRSVTEVADCLGVGQSTLTRHFRRAVGLTPKRYQRLLRLECAVGLARRSQDPDWATIAVRSGCYDQAHLDHEFGELTGLSPTRWHRAGADSPYHVRLSDDFLQDLGPSGRQDGDHERRAIPQRDTVSALSRR